MNLAWKTPTLATAAYVGRALRKGERSDLIGLSPGLVQAASDCQTELQQSNLRTDAFWDELLAQSGFLERPQAIERALARGAGLPSTPTDLTLEFDERFARIERELALLRPKLEEELPLRVRPMREAWETIGPGLMRTLQSFIEPGLFVREATVVVVHPFAGGGGVSHPATGSVTWEGMLAHPYPDLRETLRMAWMLSQFGLDARRVPVERLAALAMLPATLAAGEEFDLCRCDEPTIAKALAIWGVVETHPERAAEALLAWWGACRARRPPWETALADLEQSMPAG